MWLSYPSHGAIIVEVGEGDLAVARRKIRREFPDHPLDIEAVSLAAAVMKVNDMGLSPGGQVAGVEVDADLIPPDCLNRMMSPMELIQRGLIESDPKGGVH